MLKMDALRFRVLLSTFSYPTDYSATPGGYGGRRKFEVRVTVGSILHGLSPHELENIHGVPSTSAKGAVLSRHVRLRGGQFLSRTTPSHA